MHVFYAYQCCIKKNKNSKNKYCESIPVVEKLDFLQPLRQFLVSHDPKSFLYSALMRIALNRVMGSI